MLQTHAQRPRAPARSRPRATRRSLFGASDHALLRDLRALVTKDRATTAELIRLIAEVERRKLYRPAHTSMYRYCVHELRMSEPVAYKRVMAARVARRFPQVLEAIAEGRLHLSALMLLQPHLTAANASELLAAAEHQTKRFVRELIAQRFPQPDMPTRVRPVFVARAMPQAVTAPPVGPPQPAAADALAGPEAFALSARRLDPDPVPAAPAPAVVLPTAPPARTEPLSPGRYLLEVTLAGETLEKLRYAQDLLSHALPGGEVAAVLDRALDVLIAQLEKQRFAATDKPRAPRGSDDPRHIPAEVKRQVWRRDQGRCTKILPDGTRCDRTKFLQHEHKLAVAKGGKSTVDNVCLLCSEHNQQAADEVFGRAFMDAKREQASSA